jgi:hypothetical protein
MPMGNSIPVVNTGAGTPRNLTGGGDWANMDDPNVSNMDIQNNGLSHASGPRPFVELDEESP